MPTPRIVFCLLALCLICPNSGWAQDLQSAIAAIQKVDVDGKGHEDAVKAMSVLNTASADQIPTILEGTDGANKLAVNWLRSAVVTITQNAESLPVSQIEAYFNDKSRSALGRLMAFELLSDSNKSWANDIIPGMTDDPSLPLRRLAIKHWVESAKQTEDATSIAKLAELLPKARDVDQVVEIAELLDARGVSVNLQKQLGFLHTWQLVGSFDNKDEGGFDVAYGPEKSINDIDLAATYTSMEEKEASWSAHTTADSMGVVDLNEVVGKVKGATVYAMTNFKAEEDRDCEIRIGCINAHKVWVNGELIMANEIYHNGISPDKFAAKAKLVKGDNKILVKVCQNEQTQPWAQRWQFQLRVCDENGLAIQPAKPVAAQF